jgi:predicted dehydrogenase
MSGKPLRVGVVGAGYWAEQVHIPGVRAHAGMALAGVWNRDPARAARVADAAGVPAFADFTALLDAVDVLSFAVPPDAQAALARQAASAGRHLLLEKPLALTMAEGESLVQAVDAARIASVMFFTRRFSPPLQASLAGIAAARRWERAELRLMAGALRPGTPYTDSAWRQLHGALWDIGPHVLSMLLPVLGPVAAVAATQDAARITRLSLRHAGGGRSDIAMSLHAAPDAQGESCVFHAGDAAVMLPIPPTARLAAYGLALDALQHSIATGCAHDCDARYGLGVLRVLAAAQASLDGGGAETAIG